MADAQLALRLPPRTHVGDPASSHHAEARSRPRAAIHRKIVLALVWKHQGLNATELAGKLKGHPAFASGSHERLCQVRKRLSDLAHCHPAKIRGEGRPALIESQWWPK